MSVVEDSPRQDTPTAIDGGTLSVRLLLRDAVPCINRWLQKGKDKKFPPPHALIVNILGAQDLSCGNAYVRIWFNDRLMKRRSSFSSQGERDPVWEDDGFRRIGERFVVPLGENRCGG